MVKEYVRSGALLDTLLGPGGCPWDREQTFASLRSSLLEETHECIEAINRVDMANLEEELGDLFLNWIFFCKLGEKEGFFDAEKVLLGLNEKLIRRHPHVFGDLKVEGMDALHEQWEAIKKQERDEKKEQHKKVPARLPRTLPALERAQKVLKRYLKVFSDKEPQSQPDFSTEEALGQHLLAVVCRANAHKLDAGQALAKAILSLEDSLEDSEASS